MSALIRIAGTAIVALLPLGAFAAFEVPPNDGFVTDAASLLTEEQKDTLESLLFRYRQDTTNEIAVVIVPTLAGEPIEQAAVEIGRRWGVGSEKDNGILLLVDYAGREIFLATGYGLEGAVPDIVAKGIIEREILPQFREAMFYEGILAGIEALQKHIGGEYKADRYLQSGASGGFLLPFLLFLLFLSGEWIIAVLARSKSWWLGGVLGLVGGAILAVRFHWWLSIPILTLCGLALDYIVSREYASRGRTRWWAGGDFGSRAGRSRSGPGGSSGRRGGGTRFGGGSFGGGGAKGKW